MIRQELPSGKFNLVSKSEPELIVTDDTITIVNVYGKNYKTTLTTVYKILDYDREKLLSKQIIPTQKFHHPDLTDYSDVIYELNYQKDDLITELKVIQDTVKQCQDKIKRCSDYMKNNIKNHFFTKHTYRDFSNRINIYKYTITESLWRFLYYGVQYAQFPNETEGDLVNKVAWSQSVCSGGSCTTRKIPVYEYKLTKQGIKNAFWNDAVNDTGRRIIGQIPQVFQFPNIWPYTDLFFEGIEHILKNDINIKTYSKEEIKAPFPSNLYDTNIDTSFLQDYWSFHTAPSLHYLLKKYGFPFDGHQATTNWTYNGKTIRLNPIPFDRHKFCFNEEQLAQMSTQAVNLITGILQSYIEKYTEILNNETIKFQATMVRINAIENELSFYATLEVMRNTFNESIADPEFPDFPNLDKLDEIANKQNVPMSVAFELYNKDFEFQNVNFAYPKFVTALAISMSLMEKKINFNDLSDTERKRYLIRATKYISENIYKNDELIKLIEYRFTLFDKFRNTLTQIDRNIAEAKVDRIVEAVKKGDVVNDEVMGRMNKYFHGFINKNRGTNLVDDTMGFLNITLSLPKITLPTITIPPIKIPEINIINIKLPSSFNPMDAALSLVGASDEYKQFSTMIVNDLVRSSIYVPVVSEIIGVGEQVGQGVEDLAEGVYKAGGQFIESTGQFIANSPQMVADIVKATGQLANDLIISPIEKLIDGVAYAILPRDIARKIDSITDVPSKAATGKLTVEDLKEAGQAVLKLGVAPLAFAGKISADVIDTARKNIPLIDELDKYSGGLLSSSSNIARATHVEYEGKGHSKTLILDIIKVGMVVASGGSASAVLNNVAETTATNLIVDKTGIGGDEAKALIAAYQSGDFTSATKDYISDKAMVEGSKEVGKQTGLPMQDVYAIGKGVQEGKPVSEALVDAGEGRAKREINEEVKKKTGLPITVSEIMSADPNNKNSMVQEMVTYAQSPERLKELVVKEAKIAMEKERKKIEEKVATVVKLADNIQNFNLDREVEVLSKRAVTEIDNRQRDLERLDKEIENFSSADAWEQTKHQARVEKDRAIRNIYEEAYKLKEKYYPDTLLNYLMFYFGPKPDYSVEMEQIRPEDWQNFELPQNGVIFKQEPYKRSVGPMVAVLGAAVGAVVAYNMMES